MKYRIVQRRHYMNGIPLGAPKFVVQKKILFLWFDIEEFHREYQARRFIEDETAVYTKKDTIVD